MRAARRSPVASVFTIRFYDHRRPLCTVELFFVRTRTTIRVVTRQSVTGCEGKNENKIVPSRRAITWDASPQICPLLNPSRRIALIALLIAIFTRVCAGLVRAIRSHVFVSMCECDVKKKDCDSNWLCLDRIERAGELRFPAEREREICDFLCCVVKSVFGLGDDRFTFAEEIK